MTALLAVIAFAALATLTLTARPLVAIPGGLLATTAWWVAASASVGMMHGAVGVAYTAFGIGTAGFTLADGVRVARRERDRLADDVPVEPADLYPQHQIAVENVRDEIAGGAR